MAGGAGFSWVIPWLRVQELKGIPNTVLPLHAGRGAVKVLSLTSVTIRSEWITQHDCVGPLLLHKW